MTVIGTVQCVAGGGFVALDGRVVRPGARHRHRGPALRAGVCRLEHRGADRLGRSAEAARRSSAARIALLALPASAVLGLGAALAPNWQLAAVGTAVVERRLHAGRGQHDLVPARGHARGTDGTGQHSGRMLSWGVGWTLGAALGGLLGHILGIQPALVVMTGFGFVAVAVAWRSPLRGFSAGSPTLSADDSTAGRPRGRGDDVIAEPHRQDFGARLAALLGPRHRVAAAVSVSGTGASVASTGCGVDDDFEIGSISKGLTGLLYVDALERGEVTRRTTTGDVLPLGSSAASQVRLDAISRHRSGLPRLPRVGADRCARRTPFLPARYEPVRRNRQSTARAGPPHQGRQAATDLLELRIRAPRACIGARGRYDVRRTGRHPDRPAPLV